MNRQVLILASGQCGVQTASATWELFAAEHNINLDGELREKDDFCVNEYIDSIFSETEKGRFVPRGLTIDLDPMPIEEIRYSVYRTLFNPETLISGMEDAATNFARGFMAGGNRIKENCFSQLRKQTEQCDILKSFFYLFGSGGGTGGGFSSLMLTHCNDVYPKIDIVAHNVMPGYRMSSCIVEPYNIVLTHPYLVEKSGVNILHDNMALYKACMLSDLFVRPTFVHLNRLVVYQISNILSPYRFETVLSSDLTCMQTNLVPYPRLNFLTTALAPIKRSDVYNASRNSINELTNELYLAENCFLDCHLIDGFNLACCIHYRGKVSPAEINKSIMSVKARGIANFVEWTPTGFKIGLVPLPPVTIPSTNFAAVSHNATLIANNTEIQTPLCYQMSGFKLLFAKRAFVHHFVGEGLEESELSQALTSIAETVSDYRITTEAARLYSSQFSDRSGLPSSDGDANSANGTSPRKGGGAGTRRRKKKKKKKIVTAEPGLKKLFVPIPPAK